MLSVWFRRDNQQTNGPPTAEEIEDKLQELTDRVSDIREANFDVPGGVVHVRVGRTEEANDGRVLHYSEKSNGIYFVREKLDDSQIQRVIRHELYPPAHVTIPITDGEIDGMHYTMFYLRDSRIRVNRTSGYDGVFFKLPEGFRAACGELESRVRENPSARTSLYGENPDSLTHFLDDVDGHMKTVSRSVGGTGSGSDSNSETTSTSSDSIRVRLANIIQEYCTQDTSRSVEIHVFLGEKEFMAIVSPSAGSRSLYLSTDSFTEGPKYTGDIDHPSDDAGSAILQQYIDLYDPQPRNTRRRVTPSVTGFPNYVPGIPRRLGGGSLNKICIAAGIAVTIVSSFFSTE